MGGSIASGAGSWCSIPRPCARPRGLRSGDLNDAARHDEHDALDLSAGEEVRVARVLARAFRDNPLNRAVIGGDEARRLRANLATMRLLVPAARGSGIALVVRARGAPVGALLATPPGGYPLPPPPVGARIRALWSQGLRVAGRWRVVFETLDAAHPRGPHWYLGVLGVDPDWQHRGVGRALLARFVALADARREPAYLETDRPENVGFYARAGFRVAGELDVFGARVHRMERPPRV